MPHVAQWKKEEVQNLKELIKDHNVVGIANLADIPATQLQEMRQNLRDSATVKMSRKTLMSIALGESGKSNIENLGEYMEGQPAMIFTDINPFKLYKILEASKTPTPAKAGSVAPSDIVIPQGETPFKPGPILGEIQKIGIPAKIDKGKIVIIEDKTVVAEGEAISKEVASILTRLDIRPLEVGIDLRAVYEDQTVYTPDILIIDKDQTLRDIQKAFWWALNLSVNGLIYNKESVPSILQKAVSRSMNLAINAEILTSRTTDILLSKAFSQMLQVASILSSVDQEALDEKLLEKLKSPTDVEIKEKKESEEEEEEESEDEKEEEAAAGLGALFG